MLDTHLSDEGTAIGGFDATEYFNGEAVKGSPEFQSARGGAVYHFASAANKEAYDADPEKYLPQYNGWCATAASEGKYFYSNPEAFIVQHGKLFLFFDDNQGGDTRVDWHKDPEGRQVDADRHWAADDLSDVNL